MKKVTLKIDRDKEINKKDWDSDTDIDKAIDVLDSIKLTEKEKDELLDVQEEKDSCYGSRI